MKIVHLYPDLLRTYGDRGNVLALARRAHVHGIDAEIVPVTRGEPLPADADVVFIGGGSDRVQRAIGPDLLARADDLRARADAGAAIVGVCGGYQLLGHYYAFPDGSRIEGLGLLDVTTVQGEGRIIGRVHATGEAIRTELLGFENHGGRTHLGPNARAIARVGKGCGNNGVDGTEGAVQGAVVGTYLHGPVLVLNPDLTDWIIATALGRSLDPAASAAEQRARAAFPRSRK